MSQILRTPLNRSVRNAQSVLWLSGERLSAGCRLMEGVRLGAPGGGGGPAGGGGSRFPPPRSSMPGIRATPANTGAGHVFRPRNPEAFVLTFDGKRMRNKSVLRRTVDYNPSMINYLEVSGAPFTRVAPFTREANVINRNKINMPAGCQASD